MLSSQYEFSRRLQKGNFMPNKSGTHTLPWTAEQSILIDHVGNEVYASHYAERKISRIIIGLLACIVAYQQFNITSLAHRPVQTRYVRINEIGQAQPIAYSDLNYSPQEGEVMSGLTSWAGYRYTINRETISKEYPLNYYFLSQSLANEYMSEDNSEHLMSQVLAGQKELCDIDVKSVAITSMSIESVAGAKIARGTALINLDKLYSPRASREPRREHWVLSVTYYIDPRQVDDKAKVFPKYETINPLGVTITELHENRISVELVQNNGSASMSSTMATKTPGGIH
jgi:type IV secretion system protein VirB5